MRRSAVSVLLVAAEKAPAADAILRVAVAMHYSHRACYLSITSLQLHRQELPNVLGPLVRCYELPLLTSYRPLCCDLQHACCAA